MAPDGMYLDGGARPPFRLVKVGKKESKRPPSPHRRKTSFAGIGGHAPPETGYIPSLMQIRFT